MPALAENRLFELLEIDPTHKYFKDRPRDLEILASLTEATALILSAALKVASLPPEYFGERGPTADDFLRKAEISREQISSEDLHAMDQVSQFTWLALLQLIVNSRQEN